MQNCPNLRTAHVAGATIDDATLIAAASNCLRLQELEGEWTVTSTAVVKHAAHFLQQLYNLSVTLPSNGSEGTIDTLCSAITYCTKLSWLSLEANKTERVLEATAISCHSLQSLVVRVNEFQCKPHCTCGNHLATIAQVNARSLSKVHTNLCCRTPPQLAAIVAPLKGIQAFSMLGSFMSLDDNILCTLSANSRNLNTIDPVSPRITDRTVRAFAQHNKKLWNLNLQQCDHVTEAAIVLLVQLCQPNLQLTLPDALSYEARERIRAAVKQIKA
jgi:hypothetical protein